MYRFMLVGLGVFVLASSVLWCVQSADHCADGAIVVHDPDRPCDAVALDHCRLSAVASRADHCSTAGSRLHVDHCVWWSIGSASDLRGPATDDHC